MKFAGAIRGGIAYWGGHVFGGGAVAQKRGGAVDLENVSAAQGGFVAEPAALDCLTVGLSGDSKAGGGFHVNGEAAAHQGNQIFHAGVSINRARCRVLVVGKNFVAQRGKGLCQLVVDAPKKGESVSFMPL